MLNMFQIVKVLEALSTERKIPSDINTLMNTKYFSRSGSRWILYGNMTLPQFIRSLMKQWRSETEVLSEEVVVLRKEVEQYNGMDRTL